MNKLKVMVILGTRPEIIKMSEIIKKCDKEFDLVITHTGQNYDYELNQVFFDELGLRKPDYYLDVVGDTLGDTLGNVLSASYNLLNDIKPDAIVVLGDTNSCLSTISAKRLKIPIFHLEAGNRCFDENLPEEVNRRIVDTTSDINLCYTEQARTNLLNMGLPARQLFVIGSPMREILGAHKAAIDNSSVLETLGLEPRQYILLSAHREENIDNEDNFNSMVDAINAIAETYHLPILYSMHPRSAKYIGERGTVFNPLVRAHKPFGFNDYIRLQKNAYCVVSDSGTLAEESALLGFPAVSLRTSTERPEAIDGGVLVLGSLSRASVVQAIDIAVDLATNADAGVLDYGADNVSSKVVKIIQSYTAIVNRDVWRK